MPSFIIGGDFSWIGNATFSGALKSSALTNVVTANTVYYDTISGLFSYGAAGSGGWALTGNAITSGDFLGPTNGQSLVFKVGASTIQTVNPSLTWVQTSNVFTHNCAGTFRVNGNLINLVSPTVTLAATTQININSSGPLFLQSTGGTSISESSSGDINLTTAAGNIALSASSANFSAQGATLNIGTSALTTLLAMGFSTASTVINGIVTLSDLGGSPPSGSFNVVWDPVGKVIYALGLAGSSWNTSGNNLLGGEFLGSTNAQDVVFKANATTFQTVNPTLDWTQSSNSFLHTSTGAITFTAATAMSINGSSIFIGSSSPTSTTIVIGVAASTTTIAGTPIMPNLAAAGLGLKTVMIDPVTFQLFISP